MRWPKAFSITLVAGLDERGPGQKPPRNKDPFPPKK